MCVEMATEDMASDDVRRHLTDAPADNLSKEQTD
jgi:hypothetical protein